jgi:hypothetical protein
MNPQRNSVVIERMYSKVKMNCGIFCHSSIVLRLGMDITLYHADNLTSILCDYT